MIMVFLYKYIYIERKKFIGLKHWENYINNLNGICMDGSKSSEGSCTTRRKVCLTMTSSVFNNNNIIV